MSLSTELVGEYKGEIGDVGWVLVTRNGCEARVWGGRDVRNM